MTKTEVDVLIVGAGLAGIGVAHHLQEKCPDQRYAILEARGALGGTWDLFRYPGIRSDSSMHLYGYSFRPWLDDRSIAPGEKILEYLTAAARESGIDRHIRFDTRVTRASWSSEASKWTVEAHSADTNETTTYVCRWLQMCSGYYSYRAGHTPDFEGRDRFEGEVIHPQDWPENFDASGKRIVVIGSGATAITLVPSLAKTARHVVMLQRSPSYIYVEPDIDLIAKGLRRIFPPSIAYRLTRRKNIYLERLVYKTAQNKPHKLKAFLAKRVRKALPKNFDVEKHFTPYYEPWDQRLCISPGGDIFKAIRSGQASVVTDHIETFTERGVQLKSGEELEADVIVTATGLVMEIGGNIDFDVDDEPLIFKDHWTYKGVMLSGVPNLALTSGTLIASYTLRVELIAEFMCRVLKHMDRTSSKRVTAELPVPREQMPAHPFVEGFSSGYLMRAVETFPKQGSSEPWRNVQTYADNKRLLEAPFDDGVLVFSGSMDQRRSFSGGRPAPPLTSP